MSPRERFEADRVACSDFPQHDLAQQVGAPTDASPAEIASIYREYIGFDAPEEVLDAMEAGCLAGILERAAR